MPLRQEPESLQQLPGFGHDPHRKFLGVVELIPITRLTEPPDLVLQLINADIGVALKEWIGLVAYYAMGRTDELFPGPET